MNIFVLDYDPVIASKYHCDKHCVKMVLETTQLLSNVYHVYGHSNITPYKFTHGKHPATLWAVKSKQNFNWLVKLGKSLCYEYTHRYKKIHKCQNIIASLEVHSNKLSFINNDITEFVQCMPEQYKVNKNPVEAYRKYYNYAKGHFAKWTNRSVPKWFENCSVV